MEINKSSQLDVVSWAQTSILSVNIQIVDFFKNCFDQIMKSYNQLASDFQSNQINSDTLWKAQNSTNTHYNEEIKKIYETALQIQQKLDAQEEKLSELEQLHKEMKVQLQLSIEESNLQRQEIESLKELQNILVAYGSNPEGLPALHYAIKKGDKRAVELMLQYGTNCESRAIKGMISQYYTPKCELTALHIAALYNQADIADLLIKNGAKVDSISKSSLDTYAPTPLHYAAEKGNLEMLKLLLSHGANANSSLFTNRTRTALHIAAELGHFHIVKSLVEAGAQVNSGQKSSGPETQEKTPLDLASQSLNYSQSPLNLELVRFLVENGGTRNQVRYHIPGAGYGNMCEVISGYLKSKSR